MVEREAAWAGSGDRQRRGDDQQVVLVAAGELKKPFLRWTVPIALSITTVSAIAANGVSSRKRTASPAELAETGDDRHRERSAEAEPREERSRTGRPAAAEGAEQLLRPVRG